MNIASVSGTLCKNHIQTWHNNLWQFDENRWDRFWASTLNYKENKLLVKQEQVKQTPWNSRFQKCEI